MDINWYVWILNPIDTLPWDMYTPYSTSYQKFNHGVISGTLPGFIDAELIVDQSQWNSRVTKVIFQICPSVNA